MIAQSYATGHIIESRIYPQEGESFEVGDLLSITESSESAQATESARFTKSQKAYDQNIVGVAEYNETDGYRPTFAGVFETKVSTINGSIKAGDPITSSDIPGVGMKATKAGQIIGKTLEPYDNPDPNVIGKILVFINLSWYDPDVYLTSTGELKIVASGSSYIAQHTTTGNIIDKIGAFAELVTGKLRVGLIETKKLIVDGVDLLQEMRELKAENNALQARIEAIESKLK